MTYYRLALQDRQTRRWSWKTTALTSLDAVFELLRGYRALLPQDRIRVFTASAKEELHEQLGRENNGLASGSVTASQFLQERHLLVPQRAQSASHPSSPAQEPRPGAAVATWARDLWEQHALLTTAQAQQTGATTVTSPLLRESIATRGTAGSLGLSVLDQKRVEIELGPGGDHDIPYRFAWPAYMPQVLAWMRLLAKVQHGELEP